MVLPTGKSCLGESSSAEELSNKTQTRGDFIWLKMSTECVFIIDQLSVA